MELQQLRYVLALAEARNFTRAAEACFVVQSVLSHQIAAIERELGVRLFARSSRRVELTAAGAAFLPAARAALDAVDRAATEAVAATGVVRGTLRLGAIPTVTAIDLPRLIVELRTAHPDVRVEVRAGGSGEFLTAIAAGDLDAAIVGLPVAAPLDGVATRELARERLVAVLAAGHPLAARRRVRLADLADDVFVDFAAGTTGRAQSDTAFADAGLERDVAFEAADTRLMLDLVAAGLAVALLPAGAAPARRDLTTVRVADGPQRVELLAWSAFNPSPGAEALLAITAAQLGAGTSVAGSDPEPGQAAVSPEPPADTRPVRIVTTSAPAPTAAPVPAEAPLPSAASA